jgi:pimeloyl-ACP methyl ester carboxylesterase
MARLGRRLEGSGHRTTSFGYRVLASDLETVRGRFVERVLRDLAEDAADGASGGYAVVGHSLGGVITRLASPDLPPGFSRFVMLGVPNRSPAIARALGKNPAYRLLAGDAGRRLADPAFFRGLPVPDIPSLIVAGTAGPRVGWLPAGPEPNDGIVKVSETGLDGVARILVPAMHTFLMSRRDVFEAIRRFLDEGEGSLGGPGQEAPDGPHQSLG